MKYWIDRIEEHIAVCENGQGEFISIPTEKLPEHINEGDCMEQINEDFVFNQEATELRKKQIRDKMNRLFSD